LERNKTYDWEKAMRTRIISAFPGTGKSFYHKNHAETTLDSDSSFFSWVETVQGKVRNPQWPENYIKYIKENIGKYEFIFVSTHKEVREALLDSCIFFYLIYPDEGRKDLYLDRFKRRGSSHEFIELLDKSWGQWLKELSFCEYGCSNVRMSFPFLDDELAHIICSENGDKI
jgi:hypothetical protein